MELSLCRPYLRRLFLMSTLGPVCAVSLASAQPAAVTSSATSTRATAPTTTTTTAKTTSATTPAAPAAAALTATAPAATEAAVAGTPIGININGRNVEADPSPLLRDGTVFVPLRGVLENLGAKVTYDPLTSRIDILHDRKRYSMQVGETAVAVETSVATLSSAPFLVAGRAFVPLRALAELFGYNVQWLPATQVVAIVDKADKAVVSTPATVDHRALLRNAGRFGVAVNFHDANPNDVDQLLDAVKRSGATMVKFRFDWNALEPTKGSAFQWPLYDRVVAGARARGLTVIGVLGNTTRWATLYPRSENPNEWRNSPPKTEELPAWENYVRRVVGRYRNDVQAWQIWENPATYNFRSVAKDYRIVARRAVDAARSSDSKAILFAGEPGGVNLGFIEELRRNGLMPHINGVSLYPVSQWQPGVEAHAEEMVLPLGTLYKDPQNRDKEYWVHGLSRLSLEQTDLMAPGADKIFNTKDIALRKELAQEFTPAAQADYLVRAMTLALAAGTDKLFWGTLRDEPNYDRVDPVNSFYGGGLLKRDGTQRPSFAAYSTLVKLLEGKKFVGAVAAGPRAVVLIFENGKETVGVAWAGPGQTGQAKLTFDPSRDPGMPSAIHLQTNAGSEILDSAGTRIGGDSGQITLSARPIWLTSISFKVPQNLRDASAPGVLSQLISNERTAPDQEVLRAVFAPGNEGVEDGLYWRKYLGFRGAANNFENVGGRPGLKTTISRDVMNPAGGLPSIYLDVANDYLFFARGTPVKVTIEVKRPAANEGPFAPKGGFNLQYDSPSGFRMTPWQVVEGGDGWATFVVEIPDASFANRDGFDLMVNTWGAKQDLVFRSVTLERVNARVAAEEVAPVAAGN